MKTEKFIERIEPTSNLKEVILLRINETIRKRAKIRLIYAGILDVISVIALVPLIQYFIVEFGNSGFYQYLSLAFSDSSDILMYWKDLALSLLESVPIQSITAILALIFILLAASKFIIQDSKILFNKNQLA